MSRRIERVNQLLKEEVGKIIHRDLDLEEDVLVTVSNVDVSRTLEHAKVSISVLPLQNGKKVLDRLNKFIYSIQQELNKKLALRSMPKIFFVLDESEAKAKKIEEILKNERM